MSVEVKSLLSISSHVSHGYVGNRAMVFPFQFSGWDVDSINTTDYSNHPGYRKFKGKPTSAELITDLFLGLKDIVDFNEEYEIILTGYSPNDLILEIIYQQVMSIYNNSNKKKPVWIVDPVLGDNGKLYVPDTVVPIYEKILASGEVNLITPNQFEFEVLSGGKKIRDWDSLKLAIEAFESKYNIPNFVISSIIIEDKMYSLGYSHQKLFIVPIEQIDCNFNGCGDVFTSLLTNAYYNNQYQLTPQVLTSVLIKLNKILHHSLEQEHLKIGGEIKDIKLVKDIRIISSRHVLLEDESNNPLLSKVVYI